MKKKLQPNLSVAIIARDEADLLPRCLESLQYGSKPHPTKPDLTIPNYIWDELVVVVDTRTTDDTAQVAKGFGAKVYPYEWSTEDRFAPRNFAESKCTGKYIFWQDADEVLVEGHDVIKEIVNIGELDGIKPYMEVVDGVGYIRQELLHKNNEQWRWEGALHEYLCGPASNAEKRIVQLHLPRPLDRPHPDPIGALYANLGAGFNERHLFYLLREYFYAGRWQTTIALVDLMLKQPVHWGIQRSHACILKGDSYGNLGDSKNQTLAYLDAIQEWPNWAEPYYALGKMYYEQREWQLGSSWLYACLPHNPPAEYFTELSIYEWRRYDLLAVCLHRLGKNKEALPYGEIALKARPDDARLQDNLLWYKQIKDKDKSSR